MMSIRVIIVHLLIVVAAAALVGCGGRAGTRTGFLSSYARLDKTSATETAARDGLKQVASVHVEPVEIRLDEHSNATAEKADELAADLQQAVEASVAEVRTASPGRRIAIRMALTHVKRSTPILNIHPATKLTGAGLGEAGIEAEIIDADTGEQLWAIDEIRKGNRLKLDVFDEYNDARDAISYFAERIGELLRSEAGEEERASATPYD